MNDLQKAVQQQIDDLLKEAVKDAFNNLDIPGVVNSYLNDRLEHTSFTSYLDAEINQRVNDLQIGNIINDSIDKKTSTMMAPHVKRVVTEARDRVDAILVKTIDQHVKSTTFPEASINPSAINWTNFQLSVNQVQGAKELAEATVKKATETDHLEVDIAEVGTLILKRGINKDTAGFTDIVDAVADSLPPVDVPIIDYSLIPMPEVPDYTSQFKDIKEELNKTVKLRGNLPELEVSGEALLSDVLYTTPGNKRVGINTMDPSDALTVWDQEAEIVIGKHKTQEGYIGTRRRQDINIGANNKVGITVRSDGSVAINKLQLMGRVFETSDSIPGAARKKGDITLNSNPTLGGSIGWVCLDGLKWASFGKIEE
jgi:hypothetical protein